MNIKTTIHIASLIFLFLGLAMLIPACINFTGNHMHAAGAYSGCSLIVVITSTIITIYTKQQQPHLNIRETFLLTNLIWIGSGLIAALPMMYAEHITYTDAVYEAISGIATCGGSIFKRLADISPGTILWRSLLQWIGGIGFMLVGIAIFPFLKLGGMRLLHIEFSDTSEKILPTTSAITKRVLIVYSIATISCIALLVLEGMHWFDAINFSFSTISTGGFAPHDASVAYYNNFTMYWTIIFFMLFGSVPMILVWRFFRGEFSALIKDSQVKVFISVILCMWLVMSVWLWLHSDYSFSKAFTLSVFDTTSIFSTTGFVLTDYTSWGSFAICMFFFIAFVGGCSGSTAGGLKVFRLQISFMLLSVEMKKKVHPHAVIVYQYNNQPVSDAIQSSLIAFCFLYLLVFAIICLLISLTGIGFTTVISSVISNLSCVGAGLTKVTGPFGSYDSFPPLAKWLLSLTMLLGRLEIMTLLVLFNPGFWRQ